MFVTEKHSKVYSSCLHETGTLKGCGGRGMLMTIRTTEIEEKNVLNMIEKGSGTSPRKIANAFNVSNGTACFF